MWWFLGAASASAQSEPTPPAEPTVDAPGPTPPVPDEDPAVPAPTAPDAPAAEPPPTVPPPTVPPSAPSEAAPADPAAAREAALFGAPATAPDPEATLPAAPAPAPDLEPSGNRDERMLGQDLDGTESDLAARLAVLDDRLTFGGRLWLQTQANMPEAPTGADEVTLDSPNRLDLFLDARPNDRVRAYARGRLQHDWTVRTGDLDPFTGEPIPAQTVLLDQLWTKFDVAKRLYVTAGRQRLRWGTARFWNPTDFLNQQRLDPLAILDLRTGADLLKLHLPVESTTMNFYAVANLQDAQALDQIGGALRAEWAFGTSEVSATAAVRKDQPLQLGADLSTGLGPMDLRVEAAALHGVEAPYWVGQLDPQNLRFPLEADRSEEWIPQVSGGAELSVSYAADDAIVFGVEGFYNGLGYEDADLYAWLFLVGQYSPLYVGKFYGAGYVYLAGPGRLDDHTFTLSALSNLSDRSAVLRLDWRASVLTWLEPTAFVTRHVGEAGEFHYALQVDPAPGVPGLEDGLEIRAPLAEIGLGAIVRF